MPRPLFPVALVSGRSFAEPIAVVRGTERAGRDRRPAHAGWSDGRHLQLCFGMEHRRQARRLRRPAARLRGLTAEAPAEGVAMVPLTAQWPVPGRDRPRRGIASNAPALKSRYGTVAQTFFPGDAGTPLALK